MKKTRKQYEEHLNEISPSYSSDEWIIGGKLRTAEMSLQQYGKAIRKHDPIGFNVGFNEWNRK